ncbi:MAG: response regulator transcription factor [Treponema sp.]|nr:response regulator transcription factor [Treponema sp.]
MIYLLEDDDSIRKLIDYSLKSQGFDCKSFSLPSDFWKNLEKEDQQPELILLDLMLPQEDGISILKKLRSSSQNSKIPVIILTAKDTEFDVVTGLDSGADDYITKPFGMMTLISRIKAVLRRYDGKSYQSKQKILEADKIKIDITRHTVFSDNKQIFLTVKEFDLLVLLIENRPNVLTREQLLDSIWKIDADIESRTVDVHIRTLRQKLGDAGNIIETVRGVGYKCL